MQRKALIVPLRHGVAEDDRDPADDHEFAGPLTGAGHALRLPPRTRTAMRIDRDH